MLSAFGDESSDASHQRIFAVSALFGEQHQWDALEVKWRARLPQGIDFHASDCECDGGDFNVFDHAHNKALYKDLTQLLADSGVQGYGVAIDLVGQAKFMGPLLPESAYYKCFAEVVIFFTHRAVLYIPREQVKFTFDRRLETQYNATELYDYLSKMPEWEDHEYLHEEIGFASRKSVGVQAADLYTYEIMKYLDNKIGPVKRPERKSMQALDATQRFGGVFYVDDYFKVLRQKIDGLLADGKAALDVNGYQAWLSKCGLTDNYGVRVRYLAQRDGLERANGNSEHFEDVGRWSMRRDLPDQ